MKMVLPLIVVVVAIGGALAWVFYQDDERIARGVAEDWAEEASTSLIEDLNSPLVDILLLQLGAVPSAVSGQVASLVRDTISDQISDATWTFSEPERLSDDRYEVTATASVEARVSLPLLGGWTFGVEVPFDLEIDTDRRMVTDSTLDAAGLQVRQR